MSKKSRTERRINGGLAIYYGMGAMLGAISSVIGLLIWGVKVFMGTEEFRWDVPRSTDFWITGGFCWLSVIKGRV